MAEDALFALHRAIQNAFIAASVSNAYPDYAPSGAGTNYYLYWWLGGGSRNDMTRKDAVEFLMGIKRVAIDQEVALVGAALITATFDNKGIQDVSSGALSGGTDWAILTSTKELRIHVVEQVGNASQRYHEGEQYRFLMERIT